MASPFSSARHNPVKVTTAPMSVRPRVSFSTSAATSKASCCRRIVVVMTLATSAAGHRREERDLVGAGDRRIGAHVMAVDCGADHLRIFESVGVTLAAPGEPADQIANGGDAGRRLDLLLRHADALAHPGEIQKLHASSRVR